MCCVVAGCTGAAGCAGCMHKSNSRDRGYSSVSSVVPFLIIRIRRGSLVVTCTCSASLGLGLGLGCLKVFIQVELNV